jgi:hypothetical protein
MTRWPVSDRENIPWWYDALNWACTLLLAFAALVLLMAGGSWLASL